MEKIIKSLSDLESILSQVCYFPHREVHVGELVLESEDVFISPSCRIDVTGSVYLGKYSMIGEGVRILTHDHYHDGKEPLFLVQKEKGVKWQDKKIGSDVWLHECVVLYQVTEIPTGTVVGAGSVLTKNPEIEYGIYAGNPAVKVGER